MYWAHGANLILTHQPIWSALHISSRKWGRPISFISFPLFLKSFQSINFFFWRTRRDFQPISLMTLPILPHFKQGRVGGELACLATSITRHMPHHTHKTLIIGWWNDAGTVWTASSHIITAVIGSGVLSLAWAIAQLGWVAGPAVMFLFSLVTIYTSSFLAECYRAGDPNSGKRNYTYMDAVRSILGNTAFTYFFNYFCLH